MATDGAVLVQLLMAEDRRSTTALPVSDASALVDPKTAAEARVWPGGAMLGVESSTSANDGFTMKSGHCPWARSRATSSPLGVVAAVKSDVPSVKSGPGTDVGQLTTPLVCGWTTRLQSGFGIEVSSVKSAPSEGFVHVPPDAVSTTAYTRQANSLRDGLLPTSPVALSDVSSANAVALGGTGRKSIVCVSRHPAITAVVSAGPPGRGAITARPGLGAVGAVETVALFNVVTFAARTVNGRFCPAVCVPLVRS